MPTINTASQAGEPMCTVMSIRSRLTFKSQSRINPDPHTIASILSNLSKIASKAVTPDGTELPDAWQNLFTEVARSSRPQVAGPFRTKDLEMGTVYSISMIIGGPLNSSTNDHGRVMTLREGALYDTEHYTIDGSTTISTAGLGGSLIIKATVATVKRPRAICEASLEPYIILPRVIINPPDQRSGGQSSSQANKT
nr:MAG: matrix protein [Dichorhavirus sp. 'monocotyledonae']